MSDENFGKDLAAAIGLDWAKLDPDEQEELTNHAVVAAKVAIEHVRQWAVETKKVQSVGACADQIIRRILGQPPREWPPKEGVGAPMTRNTLIQLLQDAHNELYGNCYEELPARLREAIEWLEDEENARAVYERKANSPDWLVHKGWVFR
jgi:hypothetical protein